jgi:FtsH-binding integral membrane protein
MSYDNNYEVIDNDSKVIELSRSFFANVYKYMFLALTISGLVAYLTAESGWYLSIAYSSTGLSPIGYVIMFAPVALVLLIQFRYQKMAFMSVMGLFILYSVLIGLSLSFIFLSFKLGTIATTFFVTAGAFGGMALMGYYTKTDLSKMASILYMLFFGMFIASIVNVFVGSDTMGYVISFLGLFVFTGLTAWEMQRLKAVAADTSLSAEDRKKQELLGGLTLYIYFINLFLSILRFTGE